MTALPKGLAGLVRAELARHPHGSAVVRFGVNGDIDVVERDVAIRELEPSAADTLRWCGLPLDCVLAVAGGRVLLLDARTLEPRGEAGGGVVAFVGAGGE